MSSPEDEAPATTISSRDSSFFSLTSGNSVYFSAKDTLSNKSDENGSGEKRPILHDTKGGSVAAAEMSKARSNSVPDDTETDESASGVESNISSATLEEADSLASFSDAAELDSPQGNGNGIEGSLLKRTSSSSSVEVKKGISRLCSTIANTDSFDVSKKKQILDTLASLDIVGLGKLAAGKGGLLSSKSFKLALTLTKNF